MTTFNLSSASIAIAAAMVSTVHGTDDLSRFRAHAESEGFTNIRDWISKESLLQAQSLEAAHLHLNKVNGGAPAVTFEPIKTLEDAFDEIEEAPKAPTTPPPPVPENAPSVTVQENTTSTPSTTGTASPALELDGSGMPWDARIHAGTKTQVSAGTWKMKRNVAPEIVTQVENELRQLVGTSHTVAADYVQETQGLHPDANAFSPQTVNKLVESGNGSGVVPSAPATTQAPNVGSSISTFAELMPAITRSGIPVKTVQDLVISLGCPSLPLLNTADYASLIPFVASELKL